MSAESSCAFRAASISVKLLVGGDESVELSKMTALASQRRESRSALLMAEIAIILRGGEGEATEFALKQKGRVRVYEREKKIGPEGMNLQNHCLT